MRIKREEFNSKAFGEHLEQLRNRQQINQRELADRIGSTAGSISGFESGKAKPSADMMALMAKALNISMSELLDFDGENDRQGDGRFAFEPKTVGDIATTLAKIMETSYVGNVMWNKDETSVSLMIGANKPTDPDADALLRDYIIKYDRYQHMKPSEERDELRSTLEEHLELLSKVRL